MPSVAIVGCGDVSTVHFAAVAAIAEADLVAVCDTDPATLVAAQESWDVPGYSDHREMLAAVRPDVVHVCTPHDQHAEVTIACLEAGVAVLQEKPLAHTVADGDRIVRAAETTGGKVGICFQNRYNATAMAVRDLLDSGRLGAVLGGSGTVLWHRPATYYEARPWRGRWRTSGGGVMINQAIHTLDLLQWYLGDVIRVDGHVSRRLLDGQVEVEDTAELTLGHATGARSVMFATNANVVDSPVTVEIVTEEATLFIRGDLTIRFADGRVEQVAERVAATSGRAYWGASHQLLIKDFYDRLDEPEPFWIGPREAAKTLQIIDQLYTGSDLAP